LQRRYENNLLMRLFFIPGFGEETSIFNKIKPYIQGEKIFIENWTELYNVAEQGLTVAEYAVFLIEKYKITEEDVVVGHSMGGWVALQIKQLTDCRVVQLSSWTDGRKVVTIPINRRFMFWLAKRGIGFYPFIRDVLIWLFYKNRPSRKIFKAIFNRIRLGDKRIVVKQLMVIFNPLKSPITVMPDLRIHAKGDHIINPPDERYVLVPGDHFSLYTYPETVYSAIHVFLNTTNGNITSA
jgi:pimeloyl-ACP methyl ester carboxylesterase